MNLPDLNGTVKNSLIGTATDLRPDDKKIQTAEKDFQNPLNQWLLASYATMGHGFSQSYEQAKPMLKPEPAIQNSLAKTAIADTIL